MTSPIAGRCSTAAADFLGLDDLAAADPLIRSPDKRHAEILALELLGRLSFHGTGLTFVAAAMAFADKLLVGPTLHHWIRCFRVEFWGAYGAGDWIESGALCRADTAAY